MAWDGAAVRHLLYLDPGSASFLLQAIIGAFFGFLVIIKAYWQRITNLFRRRDLSKLPSGDEDDATKR